MKGTSRENDEADTCWQMSLRAIMWGCPCNRCKTSISLDTWIGMTPSSLKCTFFNATSSPVDLHVA